MFRLTGIRIDHRLVFQKALQKNMDAILRIRRNQIIYTSVDDIERRCRSRDLKREIRRKETRKTDDVLHPVRITGNQVDNLPNISSSFRIVNFCSLVLFLLFLGLCFTYQNVKVKEANSGKNLPLEPLLATSSLSLLVIAEKSFLLRALS